MSVGVLTCGLSSCYASWRWQTDSSGTSVPRNQHHRAEGKKTPGQVLINQLPASCFPPYKSILSFLHSICVFSRSTETTTQQWDFGRGSRWLVSGQCHLCGGLWRTEAQAAPRGNRKPGGEEDAPLPWGDTSALQTPAQQRAHTPTSPYQPPSPLSFHLSHCEV